MEEKAQKKREEAELKLQRQQERERKKQEKQEKAKEIAERKIERQKEMERKKLEKVQAAELRKQQREKKKKETGLYSKPSLIPSPIYFSPTTTHTHTHTHTSHVCTDCSKKCCSHPYASNWVSCKDCGKWLHCMCVGVNYADARKKSFVYECNECSK